MKAKQGAIIVIHGDTECFYVDVCVVCKGKTIPYQIRPGKNQWLDNFCKTCNQHSACWEAILPGVDGELKMGRI